MKRMTGLDATFLYLETAEQSMVINGIVHLDVSTIKEGYSFDRLQSGLARQVKTVPPFRRKLHDSKFNVGHPAWVEDFDFDITNHVRRVVLESNSGEADLLDLCGRIASRPLDRAHPLWQATVIEWGDPADPSVSVFCRVHHAVLDGVLGAELLSKLAASDESSPDHDPEMVRTHVGNPNRIQLIAGGAWDLINRPLQFLRLLPETLSIPKAMKRTKAESGGGESMPAPFTAPRTLFNQSLTPHRAVGTATLDLAQIKEVCAALGGTVNDVLLTVIGGAVRAYLEVHDDVPETSMVAICPISTRAQEVSAGANQVSAMFAALATDEPDVRTRFERIAAASDITKKQAGSIRSALLDDWGQMSPRLALTAGMKAYEFFRLADVHPVIYNLIVSNVPGPKGTIYFLGARITSMHPFGPLLHGAGVSVTSVSFDGHLDLGVISCEHLVPDPMLIARGIESEFEALLALARD